MNIILNEIKKLFTIKIMFLIVLVNIVMYFLFTSFYVKYFPNGRPGKDIYNIVTEMKNKYGNYLDDNEFADFKKDYNKQIQNINKVIRSRKEFKELGINNYDEFKIKDNEYFNGKMPNAEKFNKLKSNIFFKEKLDLFWEIPEREEIIKNFNNRNKNIKNWYMNDKSKDRINEIIKNQENRSVFNYIIFDNYDDFIINVCRTILITIVLLISPIYLKDKKNNLIYIQYTSKQGRKLFKSKIIAAIIASFLLTTVELIIYFIKYFSNGTSIFLDCNINSALAIRISWYNITFGQYIIISIIALYLLVFFFTSMSMFISSKVKNYIGLIGIQIPIIYLIFKIILPWAIRCIGFITSPYYIVYNKGSVECCYLVVLTIFIAITFYNYKFERNVNIY